MKYSICRIYILSVVLFYIIFINFTTIICDNPLLFRNLTKFRLKGILISAN